MFFMSLTKKLDLAKKNKSKVKITLIGGTEYIGVITARPQNNVKIKLKDGTEHIMWFSSITGLEIFEKLST